MRLLVLGSAAGGGVPQWNCGCANCAGARSGAIVARSQTSVALSSDGREWLLLSASPDLRAQLESFAPLHPRALRDTPIRAVALPNGDLDACLGLLLLRESQPFAVHATATVTRGLREGNVLFRTLERTADQVAWHALVPGRRQAVAAGLTLEAVPLPGKVPLHLEREAHAGEENNVGLMVRDEAGHSVAYFPSVGGPSVAGDRAACEADVLLFDGTFFEEDELCRLGLGTRRASDMAHWPLGGDAGSLAWLATLPCRRKLLVHVNNSNPILRDDAPERKQLAAAGVELAYDGLELEL